MSDPRIGRILVASLHQAIAELLPGRIEFYETWLTSTGLREGSIGVGPLSAVLSFLRLEPGSAYNQATSRAGEYAAEWTVNTMSPLERRVILALPAPWRLRRAMRVARALVTSTYPGSRAIVKRRGGAASVQLRGSLFCEVRETSASPLCGFYAAAFGRVLTRFNLPADVHVHQCRAAGARQECELEIAGAAAPAAPSAAA
jgi:bacteriochlorophyll 4-vinyl reductase